MTTPHDETAMSPRSDAPFGAPPRTARARAARAAAYAAVLAAALAAAWLATRDPGVPAEAGGHVHGAAASGAAEPVMLTSAAARRIGVTYAPAVVGPLDREIRTVGQVTFDETRLRAIAPKVDGWVERLHVDHTGQLVRAGQPLLEIYSPMLVAAQEELLLARRLAADVAGGTADAVRGADALLDAARRRLRHWDVPEGEIERIERSGEVRRTLTLVAPSGGFVVEKSVLAGQRIMAGDALYRVADLGIVWVEGEVFEQDLAVVRVGQAVVARLEAYPGEEWRGRIAYLYPTLNAETRTARVRVELPNAGLRLKPGMYATLLVHGGGRGDVLSVPRSAVLTTGERSLVFVKRADGKLEPREVVVGVAGPERIEVREGLAAGDTVVASATFLVDAESNLGTLMGGMGDMPGMDMTAPVAPGDARGRELPAAPAAPDGADHSVHEE